MCLYEWSSAWLFAARRGQASMTSLWMCTARAVGESFYCTYVRTRFGKYFPELRGVCERRDRETRGPSAVLIIQEALFVFIMQIPNREVPVGRLQRRTWDGGTRGWQRVVDRRMRVRVSLASPLCRPSSPAWDADFRRRNNSASSPDVSRTV